MYKNKNLMLILKQVVEQEIDLIVQSLMERFDEEIVPYEDEEDPARPSLCKEEFKIFLKRSLKQNIKIKEDGIEIEAGDKESLGLGEALSKETTDCIKIIGTILQGISGNYILVTSDMTGGPEGRFGGAFLLPLDEYKREAYRKGWDPDKPLWKFSNFQGIPDFFSGANLDVFMKAVIKKFGEELKR